MREPYRAFMFSRIIRYLKPSWLGATEVAGWSTLAILAARDGATFAAYGFGVATCLIAVGRLEDRRRRSRSQA